MQVSLASLQEFCEDRSRRLSMACRPLSTRRYDLSFWCAFATSWFLACADVFLTGFSRGAYQLRSLAGMIEKVLASQEVISCCLPPTSNRSGSFLPEIKSKSPCRPTLFTLIWRSKFTTVPTNCMQIDTEEEVRYLYVCLSNYLLALVELLDTDELAKSFKNTFSRTNVKVHFLGAWYACSQWSIAA